MATSTPPADPVVQNQLLAAIPDAERPRITLRLVPEFLTVGEILYEAGTQLDRVYFPTSAIVSLSYVMVDGNPAEIAVIGNEGVVGVAVFLADASTPSRAVVQHAGWAYSLTGTFLQQEFIRGGALQQLLLHYTQALIAQIAQTAVCNRHHSTDQQLCRWLLLRLDRMGTDELTMTQAAVAAMVGVPQADVITALGTLRAAGLLHYSAGHISIVNRAGLEARVCECYGVVKQETERLFHRVSGATKAAHLTT